MGMRWDRCWFEGCHERGTSRQLGDQERNLCDKHAAGMERALEQPGTYRVSWGRSKAELIEDLRAKRPPLQAEADAAEATLTAYEESGSVDEWLDPEHDRLIDAAHHAEARLRAVDDEIAEVSGRTWDHPVVRVRVATEAR